jgi:hypothetical protein
MLGNQRRAGRLGSGRGDDVAWESKAMAGGGGAFVEGYEWGALALVGEPLCNTPCYELCNYLH